MSKDILGPHSTEDSAETEKMASPRIDSFGTGPELISDRLVDLWEQVEQGNLTSERFEAEEQRLLKRYEDIWTLALLLPGYATLPDTLLAELGEYLVCTDLTEVSLRCEASVEAGRDEWLAAVEPSDRQSVERFYDQSLTMLYDLMWWHTLRDDTTPLAYVTALHFAASHECHHCLDFGAGVGSGPILFARHGLSVTLADISTPMLDFSAWRLAKRQLPGPFLDLKVTRLPPESFQLVTAMDVFEHLVDPVSAVDAIANTLVPGGFLFGRFAAEQDANHPQHIVQDFSPVFDRLHELGFIEVWRDRWLWGHQAFRKE